jgi:hypothetical protein
MKTTFNGGMLVESPGNNAVLVSGASSPLLNLAGRLCWHNEVLPLACPKV